MKNRRAGDLDPNKMFWWQLVAAAAIAVMIFWPAFVG